ncbi:MAG: metal ABC transporter substrate-binding protein [Verrucomicrobiota bacterium]|nr:metal ABC transporter substrate-binding protein [Verrucomicrobiota bacterium]
MKFFWINIIRVILVGSLFLLGCADQKPDTQEKIDASTKRLSIVATTTQITDILSQLLGDSCRIYSLMGPGVDPHLYKPTARDMTNITSADLVIYHGLKLEGKLASTIEKANNNKIIAYAVSSPVPKEKLLASDDKVSPYPDPHIWFDPEIWIQCVHGLASLLSEKLPDSKYQIRERAAQLETEYRQISKWARTKIQSLPPKDRKLITSHDAFRYFGRSFGMQVISLQGISTLQEAGLGDRANLVDYIKKNQVRCLFVESSVNPKALNEIAKETGISIGAPLFSDALGSSKSKIIGPDQVEHTLDTWTGMMIHNIQSIVQGLSP